MRRKSLLVGGIQHRFLAFQLAYFVAFVAIFATLIFGPLAIDLFATETSPTARAAAAEQFLALHLRVWPALLVILLLFGIHSLLVSHRFAGPLCRFRRTFEQVGDGDLTGRVVLRRHDYLKSEGEALDRMVGDLRERIRDLAAEAAALEREIGTLESRPDVARVADLGPLREAHLRLRERLAVFRTEAAAANGAAQGPTQGQAAGSSLTRDTPALSVP